MAEIRLNECESLEECRVKQAFGEETRAEKVSERRFALEGPGIVINSVSARCLRISNRLANKRFYSYYERVR